MFPRPLLFWSGILVLGLIALGCVNSVRHPRAWTRGLSAESEVYLGSSDGAVYLLHRSWTNNPSLQLRPPAFGTGRWLEEGEARYCLLAWHRKPPFPEPSHLPAPWFGTFGSTHSVLVGFVVSIPTTCSGAVIPYWMIAAMATPLWILLWIRSSRRFKVMGLR